MKRFAVEKGWLDHLLAILPGIMGVYAVAMSVSKPQLASMLAVIVALSGIAGYGLSLAFEGTKTHGIDAWLFAILGLLGFFSSRAINGMLPEEGFPFAILAAVMMFALLVAGGLFAWRDATLLFLSLPSLVLFGLVGTIDTWRPGLFLFCGYLLCIALLYARVHQRTMIRWATEGGSDSKLLRRDVWRWMAGPEYAFAAAGTIILLSFVGAPVIQGSLTGVSENFRLTVQSQVRNSIPQGNRNQRTPPSVVVGRGPSNLSDELLFTVKMSEPHYLKTQSYSDYSPRGWNHGGGVSYTSLGFSIAPEQLKGRRSIPIPAAEEAPKPKLIQTTIRKNSEIKSILPVPGPIVEVDDTNMRFNEAPNGMLLFDQKTSTGEQRRPPISEDFTFLSQVTDIANIEYPTDEDVKIAEPYGSYDEGFAVDRNISKKLISEARALTQDSPTIYLKLHAIKEAISSKCKYNLQTEAIPSNVDVAEYFYFTSKEGYCDHFATTFTAMAMGIGLKARYVTGYLIDPKKVDENGDYIVRENQSHAWSEVFIPNYGWVAFDATEGAQNITPADGSNNFLAVIKKFFTENVSSIFAAIGIASLVGVFLLWQRRPTTEEKLNTRRAAVLNANRFQKSLELLAGHPKRFSQTHREFADFHQERLGKAYSAALPLLSTIERSLFGKNDLDPDEFKALKDQVSQFEELSKRLAKDHKRKA
ncbi:MAG: hypothetical protein KF824_02700 [Fimbriimonadaceae bacterium]|nr:MAG: hypothetical protein KF824_02700 [Fimbriimonadaceae bacterium]